MYLLGHLHERPSTLRPRRAWERNGEVECGIVVKITHGIWKGQWSRLLKPIKVRGTLSGREAQDTTAWRDTGEKVLVVVDQRNRVERFIFNPL